MRKSPLGYRNTIALFESYRMQMMNDIADVKGKLLFNLFLKYVNLNSKESVTKWALYRLSEIMECPGLFEIIGSLKN